MSLGANIVTNYVGEEKENCPLKGFVGICNPFDLFTLDRYVSKYRGGYYQRQLGFYLRHLMMKHVEELRPLEKRLGRSIEEINKEVKTYHDFDKIMTAPSFGYLTVDDYYRKGSSILKIDGIRIPTLFISPLDDPMVVKDVLPFDECLVNKNTILATHPSGGHLGFFTGIRPRQWFTEPTIGYIETVDKYYKNKAEK
eukprot:TRINITY_DN11558_c0_g2_i5.p1 TRINITY_DN11558_c0_g2~~TRINITY_DN11558_c0_g2_i5.p1  ORF type:complete len:197 (-),score=49.67 TRINITY_DN11558_c0_g2_i5:111-701(-)